MSRNRPWVAPRQWTSPAKSKNSPYKNNRWTKASIGFRLKHPECQASGCNEIVLDNNGVTDHVIPLEHGGSMYDKRNWHPLCHTCHNSKSAREKDGPMFQWDLTDRGYKIPKRDAKGNLIPVGGCNFLECDPFMTAALVPNMSRQNSDPPIEKISK